MEMKFGLNLKVKEMLGLMTKQQVITLWVHNYIFLNNLYLFF
jgi:hypothetical protein